MTPHGRLERQLVTALKRALAGGKPVVPEAGQLLWSWFIELHVSRSSNGFGPNPISWQEIESYARVRRWPLSDSHISILRAMDRVCLERAHSKKDGKTPPLSSGQKMSPSAFDAVFG